MVLEVMEALVGVEDGGVDLVIMLKVDEIEVDDFIVVLGAVEEEIVLVVVVVFSIKFVVTWFFDVVPVDTETLSIKCGLEIDVVEEVMVVVMVDVVGSLVVVVDVVGSLVMMEVVDCSLVVVVVDVDGPLVVTVDVELLVSIK